MQESATTMKVDGGQAYTLDKPEKGSYSSRFKITKISTGPAGDDDGDKEIRIINKRE